MWSLKIKSFSEEEGLSDHCQLSLKLPSLFPTSPLLWDCFMFMKMQRPHQDQNAVSSSSIPNLFFLELEKFYKDLLPQRGHVDVIYIYKILLSSCENVQRSSLGQ